MRKRRIIRKLLHNKMEAFGFFVLLTVVLIAGLYPFVSSHNPTLMTGTPFGAPSSENWLGTDSYGRDQLVRMALALRTDLMVTLGALTLALMIGVPLGLASGFFGSIADNVIMRLLDVVMAFPVIILSIAIIATLGKSTQNVGLVIGLVYAPIFARIVRAQTLVLKNEEYVHAAKAMGRSSIATLYRHILPNSFQVIAAQTMLQASFSILTISALSFFGLGVQPPQPSLGVMLKDGINFTDYAPWLSIFPGFAIFYVSLGLNLAGEGLIKATSPK